jgi:hypothetical protein
LRIPKLLVQHAGNMCDPCVRLQIVRRKIVHGERKRQEARGTHEAAQGERCISQV